MSPPSIPALWSVTSYCNIFMITDLGLRWELSTPVQAFTAFSWWFAACPLHWQASSSFQIGVRVLMSTQEGDHDLSSYLDSS